MADDIFCKIIRGEVPAQFIYRDEDLVVFRDIKPEAPIHLLVVPVKHFENLGDFQEDAATLGKAFIIAHKIAQDQGLERGYRLIINEGEHGGKLVPHLHIHLLGGKKLGPKMIKD